MPSLLTLNKPVGNEHDESRAQKHDLNNGKPRN